MGVIHINREEKRDYTKKLRKQGRSDEEIKKFIEIKERIHSKGSLNEGDKVKLDIEKIKSHPDWGKMQKSYKQFVEGNNNVIFTVKYDDKYPNHSIVCLNEDATDPQWLWWEGDLKKI